MNRRTGALPVLTLLGPTAVGKTDVALEIARACEGEIISCDSMQVYRGMNIGTAKPSEKQRREIPHHLIDIVEPEEKYDVANFLNDAQNALTAIRSRKASAIVAGGTPMYLKAFLYGLFEGPPADEAFRGRLRKEAEEGGSGALWERLGGVDPTVAERIHPNDLKRIIRALEVFEKTGRPISELQEQWKREHPTRDVLLIGLSRSRDILYARIDARVDVMFEKGLVDEVRSLKDRLGPTAGKALGYREVVGYLDGGCSLERAIEAVKNNTHNFVRKQMTWYRSLEDVNWIDMSDGGGVTETVDKVREIMECSRETMERSDE